MKATEKPNIPPYLLWEYDFNTFDFKKSYKIVIERILERGSLEDWKEMVLFYPTEKIVETINWSAQLQERDKIFSKFFLKSDMLHAV